MCEWGYCISKSVNVLFWKDNIYSVFTDIVIKATLNIQHLFVSQIQLYFAHLCRKMVCGRGKKIPMQNHKEASALAKV